MTLYYKGFILHLDNHLNERGDAMHMQDTFKALSDPTRREIIALLKDGKRSAGDIVDHLSILKQADLISDEKIGKYIYYELNTSVLDDMIGWFTSLRGEKK